MPNKLTRPFLLIIFSIATLFASTGLNAQQAIRQFQGGGPIVAQIGGTGPFNGNETGSNTWYGQTAGAHITTGANNAFFGYESGHANTSGTNNSFFGFRPGANNSTGGNNSFFGYGAGYLNMTGGSNSFFGYLSGFNNTAGELNSFFGNWAGLSNTVENSNRFFGTLSNGAAGITNATAIGSRAQVTKSDSLVLGSISGVNAATADTKVGIGTTAPQESLHVQKGNIYVGTPSQGVILKSPDGTKCAKLSIDNSGALITALQACPESAPPEKATLISPTGNIATPQPTYKWNAVYNATFYQLWVNDSIANARITTWYSAAQAGCASGSGTCSVTPATPLGKGTAQWWIQTWNGFGSGPWSDGMTFVVP